MSACHKQGQIPPWFDSIQRIPIHTAQVDGHRVAYLDLGQGPPILLVHGFGGSLWQWEYQQTALSGSFRVVTLDLLGSGFSDKPDLEYSPEQLVSFLRQFMDVLRIERAALVGNSMGAGLVEAMALTHPERVDRLVLIAGFPRDVRAKLGHTLVKRAVESRAPVWLVELGNWFAGRGLTRAVLSEVVYEDRLLTSAVIDRAYRNRTRPGLIAPILSLSRNLPMWENGFARRLHEIEQPTMIIWGAEDEIFPPAVGRELHETIPGSRFELVPDAGHIPQWERPARVNQLLLDFLRP